MNLRWLRDRYSSSALYDRVPRCPSLSHDVHPLSSLSSVDVPRCPTKSHEVTTRVHGLLYRSAMSYSVPALSSSAMSHDEILFYDVWRYLPLLSAASTQLRIFLPNFSIPSKNINSSTYTSMFSFISLIFFFFLFSYFFSFYFISFLIILFHCIILKFFFYFFFVLKYSIFFFSFFSFYFLRRMYVEVKTL